MLLLVRTFRNFYRLCKFGLLKCSKNIVSKYRIKVIFSVEKNIIFRRSEVTCSPKGLKFIFFETDCTIEEMKISVLNKYILWIGTSEIKGGGILGERRWKEEIVNNKNDSFEFIFQRINNNLYIFLSDYESSKFKNMSSFLLGEWALKHSGKKIVINIKVFNIIKV